MIALMLALQGTTLTQADYDRDAARMANRAAPTSWATQRSEPRPTEPATSQWKPVDPALIRKTSGYPAPKDYAYHVTARADLDADGRTDTVALVDNGRQGAIMITFGDRTKKPVLVDRGDRFASGQAIFAAGRNAVMINYPESRVMFLHMRRGRVMAAFVGD